MSTNPFIQTTLAPNFKLGHAIQWKIDPTFMESEPYVFTVEVSGTPDFSEIQYTLPSTDLFFSVDDTNFKQGFSVDVYYRVKFETADRNTYYSRTLIFGSDVSTRYIYHQAAEIVRKELLRLRKKVGVETYLLKRKAFGEVRQDAVDPISGVPITDNTSDYGTGLNGGYYQPLKILASYEQRESNRDLNQSGLGVDDKFEVTFRMIGHPSVETQDIIVDTMADTRFVVRKQRTVYFPGTSLAIVQILTAVQIPSTDPVYQIKIT